MRSVQPNNHRPNQEKTQSLVTGARGGNCRDLKEALTGTPSDTSGALLRCDCRCHTQDGWDYSSTHSRGASVELAQYLSICAANIASKAAVEEGWWWTSDRHDSANASATRAAKPRIALFERPKMPMALSVSWWVLRRNLSKWGAQAITTNYKGAWRC